MSLPAGAAITLVPAPISGHDGFVNFRPARGREVLIATRITLALACVMAGLGVWVVLSRPANGYMAANALLGLLYLPLPAVGALIVRRQPRNAAGWIFLLGGCAFVAKNSLDVYAAAALTMHDASVPGATWAAWISQWGGAGQAAVVSLGVLLFPDGRLPSARWRRIWPLAALVLGGLVTSQGEPTLSHWDVASPAHLPAPYGDALGSLHVAALILAPSFFSLCAWSLQIRWRVTPLAEPVRPALLVVSRCAWAAAAAQWVCLGVGAFASDWTPLVYVAERVAAVALAAGAWWAVLRHRLFDLRLAINRALVYTTLSAAVGLSYVAFLAVARGLGAKHGSAVIAVGLGALVALPLRDVVQRTVNRMVYGQWLDPYAALTQLGDQLAAAAEPESALPAACAALARALRLDRVAVVVDNVLLASYGSGGPRPVERPLLFAGERVGTLQLGHARSAMSPAEQELLDRLTGQLAPTARAVWLAGELRRSRERLAGLREEERLRIRRDLHDELGPTLAGIVLGLEQARVRVTKDPARTAETLSVLSRHAQAAVTDVRRLVHNLRPSALDDLGLRGALAEEAQRLGVQTVAAAAELPALPPATEVALYRIGLEAMANARRHSSATTVRLVLERAAGSHVRLIVSDDGIGLDPADPAGIGLSSMRARAAELGGSCSIEAAVPHGTRVVAQLPTRA